MSGKVPLFLTQASLRQTSGPAVQTKIFANAFADWLHLHWARDDSSDMTARSIRLESPWFDLWPFVRGGGSYVRLLTAAKASWWKADRLRISHVRGILEPYKGRISAIYAAPIRHVDSSRMRYLIEYFDRPFVVHYWDFLDGGMDCANGDTKWLLSNADKVFGLSKNIIDELAPYRADVEYLLFTRPRSASVAMPPPGRILNLGLIGHLRSYRDGLNLLDDAIEMTERRGVKINVLYVGPQWQLDLTDSKIKKRIRCLGFADGDEARDAALANAHVAFLSGPTIAPEADARSKFSIPSRLLDFKAVGLPVIATAHPRSATAHFLKTFAPNAMRICQSADEMATALSDLLDHETWMTAHLTTLDEFEESLRQAPQDKLRSVLNKIAL